MEEARTGIIRYYASRRRRNIDFRKLRKKSATRDLPIIMMTAKGTEYDKVLGLDSGADDILQNHSE